MLLLHEPAPLLDELVDRLGLGRPLHGPFFLVLLGGPVHIGLDFPDGGDVEGVELERVDLREVRVFFGDNLGDLEHVLLVQFGDADLELAEALVVILPVGVDVVGRGLGLSGGLGDRRVRAHDHIAGQFFGHVRVRFGELGERVEGVCEGVVGAGAGAGGRRDPLGLLGLLLFLLRRLEAPVEHVLQIGALLVGVASRNVVRLAVVEDELHVVAKVVQGAVLALFKLVANGAKIHRLGDNVKVARQVTRRGLAEVGRVGAGHKALEDAAAEARLCCGHGGRGLGHLELLGWRRHLSALRGGLRCRSAREEVGPQVQRPRRPNAPPAARAGGGPRPLQAPWPSQPWRVWARHRG